MDHRLAFLQARGVLYGHGSCHDGRISLHILCITQHRPRPPASDCQGDITSEEGLDNHKRGCLPVSSFVDYAVLIDSLPQDTLQ